MKIEKSISIRLTEEQLKEALFDWMMRNNLSIEYGKHIKDNYWIVELDDSGCTISVDGVLAD